MKQSRLFSFLSLLLLFSLFSACAFAPCAMASSSDWQSQEGVRVRLISAQDTTGDSTETNLGLEIDLPPDWHTYWRSPGDAGLPPQLDITKSQNDNDNLASIDFLYPAPHRFTSFGMEAIGYTGHVVFPLKAVLRKANTALHLSMDVNLLVCNTLCVPRAFSFTLDLPQGTAKSSDTASLINNALQQVPQPKEKSAFVIERLTRDAEKVDLTVRSQTPFDKPDIFVETTVFSIFGAPEYTLSHDKNVATFHIPLAQKLPDNAALDETPLTLTLVDQNKGLEQKIAPHEEIALVPPPIMTLAASAGVLCLALLGGLILNLMPCVLPVLSIKLLQIIRMGGSAKTAVREHFLITALGIVFSFLVLAALTVGLRHAGHAAGWGIQFQHPAFLAFLFIVVSLFAANLLGLFNLNLPRFVADRLTGLPKSELWAAFASGAFATLLATPCSAPFLGTAIGFALAAQPWVIIPVFVAMGLGMALPYLAVALYPQLATYLPHPGPWMDKLRKILGLALIITALWIGSILTTQSISTPQKSIQTKEEHWQPFAPDEIASEVAQGNVVWVNVTADWCLTCKVNKKLVWDTNEIQARLETTPHMIAMQADWTKPNDKISFFLKQNGRFGIPFDVVFGPGAPQGVVLPELLTQKTVLEAIQKAEGK